MNRGVGIEEFLGDPCACDWSWDGIVESIYATGCCPLNRALRAGGIWDDGSVDFSGLDGLVKSCFAIGCFGRHGGGTVIGISGVTSAIFFNVFCRRCLQHHAGSTSYDGDLW